MDAAPARPAGLFDSFRALGGTLLAGARDRVALFGLELQEEKFRLIQLLVWVGAAVFAAFMALTFGSLLLVYLFWEPARVAVLSGLTVFYCGALATVVWRLRRWLAHQPKPFAATRQAFGGRVN